jgi:hypothetical protein
MSCGRIKGSGIVIVGSIWFDFLLFLPLFALAIVNAVIAFVVRLIRVISADYYRVGDFGCLRVGFHDEQVVRNRGRSRGIQDCCVSSRCLVQELRDH